MLIFWGILLVLSPAILYSFASLFFAVFGRYCPRCKKLGLRRAGARRWEALDRTGRRIDGVISYHRCRCCSARLRQQKPGEWRDATAEEWNKYVKE